MSTRSRRTALVIPLRSARPRKIDLALALALLSKAVRAYESRRRLPPPPLFLLPFPAPRHPTHLKPLGA